MAYSIYMDEGSTNAAMFSQALGSQINIAQELPQLAQSLFCHFPVSIAFRKLNLVSSRSSMVQRKKLDLPLVTLSEFHHHNGAGFMVMLDGNGNIMDTFSTSSLI